MKATFRTNLILLSCSLAVALLIFEICLRILGIGYPYYDRADEHTGYSLRPHAAGWQTQEGSTYFSINSDGIRGKERTKEKPENTYRIAVLGDSMTEGRQVDEDETFVDLVEQELAHCPALSGKNIEALNFGVAGYSTTQALMMLRHKAWDFDPDYVLLTVFTSNDLSDNSPDLGKSEQKPYLTLENGELVLDTSFRKSKWFRTQNSVIGKSLHYVINRSQVLQVLNQARRRLTGMLRPPKATKKASHKTGEGEELGLDNPVTFRPPPEPLWQEAWELTEAIIKQMDREVKEHGKRFAFATSSTSIQVYPDRAERQRFIDYLQQPDLFYDEKRLAAYALQNGMTFFPLIASLQNYVDEHQVYLHGFENTTIGRGHWNEEGHKQVSILLAEKLCGSLSQATIR